MAKKGQGKKDPFEDLPPEWREAMAGADEAKLNDEAKNTALYAEFLDEQLKLDQDVKQKQATLKDAKAPYVDGKKICKLKIRMIRQIKRDRGVRLPEDVGK